MLKMIKRFIRDEEGVTAIEYGLIASLIAIVIITSAGLVGTNLDKVFDAIAGAIKTAIPA